MRYLIITLLLMFPGIASADQFIYNNLNDAVKGLTKVVKVKEVTHFCAPCTNDKPHLETVRDVGVDRVWDSQRPNQVYNARGNGYWALLINDKPVDMAYIYIRENGKWRNLAQSVGLKPQSVPETLPAR